MPVAESAPAPATTLLFLHPLLHQGRRALGEHWPEFLRLLRLHLRHAGIESRDSDAGLLVFSFSHPFSALACLMEALALLKKEMAWQPSQGALPIQAVLHLVQPEESLTQAAPFPPEIWSLLRQESLYLTRALKLQWTRLMASRTLAPHSFEPLDHDLFQVVFQGASLIRSERLFPHRELPLLGRHQECFYCGMTHHEPAACPSKVLPCQQQGLSLAGYLPFAELNSLYRTVLTDHQELVEQLISGIESSQLRQNPSQQVFLAFFDLNRIYQPRFLHQITFSSGTGWDPHPPGGDIKITNRNLHLALDCLRVGQLQQAEQIFAEESLRHKNGNFYALVGRAFCALEQGGSRDAETFFQQAAALAIQEKEQIYIGLLLSRFYDLQGDRWRAGLAVDGILSLRRSCLEGRYRQCQLLARSGAGEQSFQQLRPLATGSREMFMTVLMDPMLVPIQGLVEDFLAAHYRAMLQNAGEDLAKAVAECTELRGWFRDDQEEEMADILSRLAGIDHQYARQSYYDLFDVTAQGERLYYACLRLREAIIDRFKERFREVLGRWDRYSSFWNGYAHQPLFSRFGETLKTVRQELEAAGELTRQVRGETYLAAASKVEVAEAALNGLQPQLARMAWVKLALHGLRAFARKLVIAELVLISLGLMLFVVLQSYVAGRIAAFPEQLFAGTQLLKQLASPATILLAPLLALILTLWDLMESR